MDQSYKTFCSTMCDLFDRDWEKYSDRMAVGYYYLKHIPAQAWEPMVQMAVDKWENWPRNWVKAIKELYHAWQNEAKVVRKITDCDYCNSNGFFSGVKWAEVKPGKFSSYSYTWRCGACRNWFGVLGTKVPMSWPLEVKSMGFEIFLYSKPIPEDAKYYDLRQTIESVGSRVNEKTNRPEIQKYVDEDDLPPF